MSSSPTSSAVGLASGVRLGFYYAVFFTIVSIGLFGAAYFRIAHVIHQRELDIVRNRAHEYRAWFLNGDTKMLETWMEEQSLESGDAMFVKITGENLFYLKQYGESASLPSESELRELDPSREGHDLEFAKERWAVASLAVPERGLILQAGRNSRAGEETLAQLRRVFAVTLLPAMLAAAFAGAVLTYRAMSPIRRLIATMRDILRSGDLDRRVEPVKGRSELSPLVSLFNRLLARNKALIDSMSQSLDSVAHDFRTPLSRLNITAERALQSEDDPEQLREALADCVEESENLGRLLTTLMDVAEAEAGAMRLDLETISLPDLVKGVMEVYEFIAEEKEITVRAELSNELKIRADRTRFGQVVANLLDNAIKYSPAGGNVWVEVSEMVGRAVIRVRDEGPGINDDDLPHIWDRLYRAEPSRSTSGMGLGLSFVKAITEAHGGTASVRCSDPGGAAFEIDIPIEEGS